MSLVAGPVITTPFRVCAENCILLLSRTGRLFHAVYTGQKCAHSLFFTQVRRIRSLNGKCLGWYLRTCHLPTHSVCTLSIAHTFRTTVKRGGQSRRQASTSRPGTTPHFPTCKRPLPGSSKKEPITRMDWPTELTRHIRQRSHLGGLPHAASDA
ncbi:hypothetical protein EDB85DRAFT_136725 [Lactarius pseudohatsudake]|nr:hypothetical protein EDB85DRAFT_136725 [Lactarius pseudohatsudake]